MTAVEVHGVSLVVGKSISARYVLASYNVATRVSRPCEIIKFPPLFYS